MCGIAGIVGLTDKPVEQRDVEKMCSAIVHRGPDECGFYSSPGVGYGMRRLRIIDLETGRQPVRNEAGTVWTVFNGEIYNYRELRRRLIGIGHHFYTETDTETIVHLYEEYGNRCVDHLRGMFTFAIWDEKRKRALLARDRLGIKPLYYTVVDGQLFFASELKALLQLNGIRRDIEWRAVGNFLQTLTTPHENSIVHGIKKLPPAHRMTVQQGQLTPKVERYWSVNFVPDMTRTESSFAEELDVLLSESVAMHMVSDVPVGAFLSGGIDSSAVVAKMAKASPGSVKTFSVGFKEGVFNELPYARKIADVFGTEHHQQVLEPNALEIIEKMVWHLDEPFGDPSAIPTYMVSQHASRFVTVVLSGDGGDELFAGYEKYLVESRERRFDRLPEFIHRMSGFIGHVLPEGARGKRLLSHYGLTGTRRYQDASTLFGEDQIRFLLHADAVPYVLASDEQRFILNRFGTAGNRHWLSSLQQMDLENYLPLDILTKVDRMSMAHSIETRVPLLDHKLVEFAATIPAEMQLRNSRTKNIFKLAMRGVLPDDILERPKHGFAVPLASWFRGRLEGFARDILLGAASRQRNIFNSTAIENLLKNHSRGRDLDFHLWSLISFELWCRTFLDTATSAITESRKPYEISTDAVLDLPRVPRAATRVADVHS